MSLKKKSVIFPNKVEVIQWWARMGMGWLWMGRNQGWPEEQKLRAVVLGPWSWEEIQYWIYCSFSFILDFFPEFYLNALNLPNWVENHEWGSVVPVFLSQLEFYLHCTGFNSNLRVNKAQPSISRISKMALSNTILRMGKDVIWLFWEKDTHNLWRLDDLKETLWVGCQSVKLWNWILIK